MKLLLRFVFLILGPSTAAAIPLSVIYENAPPTIKARLQTSLQTAVDTGLRCLNDLHTPKGRDHASKIAAKLTDISVAYKISYLDKDLGNTTAYAELGGKNMTVLSQSMNDPNLPSTLFHELFHSIGFDHMSGAEYAYTCSACCFENKDMTLKELGCNICEKAYTTPDNNKEYLNDLQLFANRTAQSLRHDFSSPSIAFHPLAQWIRQLSKNRENKTALYNIIESLALNRWDLSNQVSEALLSNYLTHANSESFLDLQHRLKPHFSQKEYVFRTTRNDLKQPSPEMERLLVDHAQNAIYTCYAWNKRSGQESIKFLTQNRQFLIDEALNADNFFSALAECK